MDFKKTRLSDVIIIEPKVFEDHRGFFMETWHARRFAEAGINMEFVQDNHSKSSQGILRGLHYQIKQPQGKLVRVIQGEIFDVAVDLRASSTTFGLWAGEILSSSNRKMLWVPPGFAHGFYVISPVAEIIYKCTDFYNSEYERSIRWDDATLDIDWPLIDGKQPTLSDKDLNGLTFKEAEHFQ